MTMRKIQQAIATYSVSALLAGVLGCTAARMVYTNTSYGSLGKIVNVEEVRVYAPKDSSEASSITLAPNGTKAIALSGAQSIAEIAKVTGANKGKLILYGVAGGICVLGAVMLGWSKFNNKDAIEVLGAGGGIIALLYWLPATVTYMSFIIPVVFLGVVGYIVYHHIKTKNPPRKVTPPEPYEC